MWYLNTVSLPVRSFLYDVVTAIDIIFRYILLFIMFILHSIDLIHIPLIVFIIGGGLIFITIYTITESKNIPELVKENSRDSHLLNDVIFARKVFEPDEQKHNGVFENKLKKRLKFVVIKDLITIVLAVVVVLGISQFTTKSTYKQLIDHHNYYSESINKYKIVSDNSLTFVGIMMTNDHFNADPKSRMLNHVNKEYPNNQITNLATQYKSATDNIKKHKENTSDKEDVTKIKTINKDIKEIYSKNKDKTKANKEIYDKYGHFALESHP